MWQNFGDIVQTLLNGPPASPSSPALLAEAPSANPRANAKGSASRVAAPGPSGSPAASPKAGAAAGASRHAQPQQQQQQQQRQQQQHQKLPQQPQKQGKVLGDKPGDADRSRADGTKAKITAQPIAPGSTTAGQGPGSGLAFTSVATPKQQEKEKERARGRGEAKERENEWLVGLSRTLNVPLELLVSALSDRKPQVLAVGSQPSPPPSPVPTSSSRPSTSPAQDRSASPISRQSSLPARTEASKLSSTARRPGSPAKARARDGEGLAAAAAGAAAVMAAGAAGSRRDGGAALMQHQHAAGQAGKGNGGGVSGLGCGTCGGGAAAREPDTSMAAAAGAAGGAAAATAAKAPVARPGTSPQKRRPAVAGAGGAAAGAGARSAKGVQKRQRTSSKGGSSAASGGRRKVEEASGRERLAVMEGTVAVPSSTRPVNPPVSRNPAFGAIVGAVGARAKGATRISGGWRLPPPSGTPAAVKTVTVQPGDTLATIAGQHGLSIRELQRLNGLQSDFIAEGDVLAVTAGWLKRHPAVLLPELRPGLRRTRRPLFSRLTTSLNAAVLAAAAGGSSSSSGGSGSGRVLAKGSSRVLQLQQRSRLAVGGPARNAPVAEGRWQRGPKGFSRSVDGWLRFNSPLLDGFVSSPFGWRWGSFHEGVDLAADTGSPILASDKGTVTFAGWSGGYGKLVTIVHDNGFSTRYGHCSLITAKVGQRVSRGQQIACVGATGRATGPHLHFEVRKNGEAVDPFKWCNL